MKKRQCVKLLRECRRQETQKKNLAHQEQEHLAEVWSLVDKKVSK